jgi:hydroxypyruvate isomerase
MVEKLYRAARSVGYGAVEMAPPHRWDMARDIGLELLNIAAPGMQAGLNAPANHAELIPAIQQLIATASANHIPQIIVFTGNRCGQSDADGIAHTVEALKHLAPIAEAAGVTLLLELLCQADHRDYQADHIAIGVAIARGVDSPAVKVLYDIYHMHAMGSDPIDDIIHNLDYIGHLHVGAAEGRGVPTVDGAIRYDQLVPRVQSAGYRGWWGQEVLTSEPMQTLVKAYQLFAHIERRITPDSR